MIENENMETNSETTDNIDYIETIKQLKQTTVPKTEFDRVKAENKQLLNTLLEGGELDASVSVPQKRTSSEIREELFGNTADFNNLDFAEKALELREAIISEGGMDPFVPQGNKIIAEDSDFATAEKVAEALRSCIDYAQGDSEVFTNELMRITVDNPGARAVKGNRR